MFNITLATSTLKKTILVTSSNYNSLIPCALMSHLGMIPNICWFRMFLAEIRQDEAHLYFSKVYSQGIY